MRYPLLVLTAAVAAIACKGDSTGPSGGLVPSAIFAPAVDTIAVGATGTIQYYVISSNIDTISGVPVKVTSIDSLVAKLSGDSTSGIDSVTGVTVGTSTLVIDALDSTGAVIPGVEADVLIEVVPQTIAALSLSRTTDTLTAGTTVTLTASALQANDSASAGHTITWLSRNTQVATVSTRGIVTALEPGVARITALTDSGISATATIWVTPKASGALRIKQ